MAKNFLGQLSPATKLYVAPGGTGDGSIDTPLGSLVDARDAIQRPLTNRVEVLLREGTYREALSLAVQDSGEPGKTITYRNYPGETAILNGSNIVTGTWVDEGGGIWSLALPGQAKFRTLLINGKRKERARWPKEADYYIQADLPLHATEPINDHIVRDPNRAAPTGILPAEDVEIVNYDDFNVERHKLDPDDPTNPTWLMLRGLSNADYNYFAWYNRYYYENSKSFVTEENDWYYDDTAEKLYYWPTAAEAADMQALVVEVPFTTKLIDIQGEDTRLPALTGDFSISVWFRTSYTDVASSWFKCLARTSDGTGEDGFGLYLNKTDFGGGIGIVEGYLRIVFVDDTNLRATQYAIGANGLNDGQLHHIVVSYIAPTVATNFAASCWVDGVEVTDWTAGGPDVTGKTITDRPPTIGWNGGLADYWEGSMNDFIVLGKRITTDAEAIALRDKNYGVLENDFVLHMPLDGDFSLECDTIEAVEHRRFYSKAANVPAFDSNPLFQGNELVFDGVEDSMNFELMPGRRVSYVNFSGLKLTATDFPEVGDGGWSRYITASQLRLVDGHLRDLFGVIEIKDGKNLSIINCEIYECGNHGINAFRFMDCEFSHNHIHDIGGSGIAGYGLSLPTQQIVTNGHKFNHNTVHDIGNVERNSGAIMFCEITQSQANWNYVYNIPRYGISFNSKYNGIDVGRGNTEVGYNLIRNILQSVQHNGAIRMNGNQTGSHIHHNHVKDALETSEHSFRRPEEPKNHPVSYGLHFDQGAGGILVEFNLFENFAGGGLRSNWGSPNLVVRNNIFAKTTIAGGSGFSWSEDKFVIGADGTTPSYAINNDLQNNIYYNEDGEFAALVYWGSDASRDATIAAWAGIHDKNVFFSGTGVTDTFGWGKSAGIVIGDGVPWPLQWYKDQWAGTGKEANSLDVDPNFRFNDPSDYFVQEQAVLNLNFINFMDQLPVFP